MKKTVTFAQLIKVVSLINNQASKDSGLDMTKDTKLTRKATRFLKNVECHIDDYNEKSTEIQVENASVYTKSKENEAKGICGTIITDERGQFIYSIDGLKKRNEDLKKLNQQEIEINIVDCTDMECINLLSPFLKETFNGFLFNIPDED